MHGLFLRQSVKPVIIDSSTSTKLDPLNKIPSNVN